MVAQLEGARQETAAVEPEEDGDTMGVWWEIEVEVDVEVADALVGDCLRGLDVCHRFCACDNRLVAGS